MKWLLIVGGVVMVAIAGDLVCAWIGGALRRRRQRSMAFEDFMWRVGSRLRQYTVAPDAVLDRDQLFFADRFDEGNTPDSAVRRWVEAQRPEPAGRREAA